MVAGGTTFYPLAPDMLDILPADVFTSAFVKEDGEAVLDAEGKRIV